MAPATRRTEIAPTTRANPFEPGKPSWVIPIAERIKAQAASSTPKTWKAFTRGKLQQLHRGSIGYGCAEAWGRPPGRLGLTWRREPPGTVQDDRGGAHRAAGRGANGGADRAAAGSRERAREGARLSTAAPDLIEPLV